MVGKIIMKKRVVMLIVAIAIFAVGCGSKDVKESHGTQVIENSNMIKDTENEPHTEMSKLDDYMTTIKEQSDAIKSFLENDAQTQTEMNRKSQELYELWNNALNYLLDELESSLSEEEFSKLLSEQSIWSAEKEKSVEEAGKEVEGGSIYPLVVNMENSKITEERAYELYELLCQ